MAQAIDDGIPKLRIEEAAARTQARIDSGQQPVIGVNKYRVDEDQRHRGAQGRQQPGARRADRQAARSCGPSATRPPSQAALAALTRAAAAQAGRRRRPGQQPARAGDRRRPGQGHRRRDLRRAGEGLRPAPGRDPYHLRGVPRRGRGRNHHRIERGHADWWTKFAEADGRRPRILVAKMGQDGHDRGQKVIATAFADLGFDVDVGSLFSTPGRGRPAGGRHRRARRRGVVAGRRAPDAGAGAARRAGRRWAGRTS